MRAKIRLLILALAAMGLNTMVVAQENLVTNGDFGSDISGWEVGPASASWASTDRNGSATSGSVEITNSVRRVDQGLSQCFPAEGGTRIETGAWALLPGDASADARAITVAVEYSSEDCSSGRTLFRFSNKGPTPGEWKEESLSFTTIHDTRSVHLYLSAASNVDDLTVTALFDDVYFRMTGFEQFTLNPSLSASWHDPEQSGHGVLMHFLDRSRVWMCWFTFDGIGDPAWICALGRASAPSNRVILNEAFVMEEGQFPPNFDPEAVDQIPWGSIEIEFTGCDEGIMRWTTDAPRYSDGEMPLRRLTSLWNNPCVGD